MNGYSTSACAPLGYYAFTRGLLDLELDLLGVVFASILVGGVIGLIGGALVQFLLARRRIVRRRIETAWRIHGVDLRQLEEHASGYGNIVLREVRAARKKQCFS